MAAYQQGVYPLVTGINQYELSFSTSFEAVPNMILTQVFNQDSNFTSPLWIEAVVTSRTVDGFIVTLTQTPDSADYVMSWFAGDMNEAIVQPGLPGKGLLGLPEYAGDIPDNSYLPAVIPGKRATTQLVTVKKLRNNFATNHVHLVEQIVDASEVGKALMSGTAAQSREILRAPSLDYVQASVEMEEDATAVGKSLLSSPTVFAAREFLQLPINENLQAAVDLAASSTEMGRTVLAASSQAIALSALGAAPTSHSHSLASLGAAAVSHTHNPQDIVVAPVISNLLAATTQAMARAALNTAPSAYAIVEVQSASTVPLSTRYTGSPAETIFRVSGGATLDLDSIGAMGLGQRFRIHATDLPVPITLGGSIRLNEAVPVVWYENHVLPPGACIEVTYSSIVSGIKYLDADLRLSPVQSSCIWVSSVQGNDARGCPGRPEAPYATLLAAASAATASDIIIVTPGTYTPTTDLNLSLAAWYFMPGATVTSSYTGPLFSTYVAANKIRVHGHGRFSITGPLVSATHTGSVVQVECDSITTQVPGSVHPVFYVGAPAAATSLNANIRYQVQRPAGPLLSVPATSGLVTADIALNQAQVDVQMIVGQLAAHATTVTGGYIKLSSNCVLGTGGGGSSTVSTLVLRSQLLLGNASDGSPTTTTTPEAYTRISIQDCKRITNILRPGLGKLAVSSSTITNNVILDNDTLLLMDVVSPSGTWSTLANNPYTMYVVGSLTTASAIPLTYITILGSTPATLSALSSTFLDLV